MCFVYAKKTVSIILKQKYAISGFLFPQVAQEHLLGEMGK